MGKILAMKSKGGRAYPTPKNLCTFPTSSLIQIASYICSVHIITPMNPLKSSSFCILCKILRKQMCYIMLVGRAER